MTIQNILDEVRTYRPGADLDRIERAYNFAKKFHRGQTRFSGHPYIEYLMDVVSVLLTLRPDEDTLSAALLQEVAKDDAILFEDIQKRFGKNVARLLAGLKKMKAVKSRVKESEIETLRKMFLAIAEDLRVVLIKLAGRLVSMKTLEYLPDDKRKKIARETADIYVPVATRLGIYKIKSQLEDLAFKHLYPKQYENIADQLAVFGSEKGAVIGDIKGRLDAFLAEHSIEAKVEGRLKTISSIYRKLKRKSRTSVDEIFDIFAMRIILPTEFQGPMESFERLYTVLGLIHTKWVPLANRFKDYVAVPKPNGYQSLHTTVLGLAPKEHIQPVEIQIRSERMHEESEYGIASHWLYESTSGASANFDRDTFLKYALHKGAVLENADKKYQRQIEWLSGLAKLQEDLDIRPDSLEDMRLDIFSDRIFVLTPQGEVKDLPASATPVDFAYAVHTDIGHRCAMAKVNGFIVPLDYELKNGDVVKIILKPKPNPKPHWLSFVKTSNAKAKIKSWFRSLDSERNIKEGRKLLNKHLRRYGKSLLDDSYSILKSYGGKKMTLKERERLLEEIGTGAQLANLVVRKLFAPADLLSPVHSEKVPSKKCKKMGRTLTDRVLVGGEPGLPLRIAACCSPREDSQIVAYVTKDHSITIHRRNCSHVSNLNEARLLDAAWSVEKKKTAAKYRVRFLIEAVSRIGLLRDISSVIASFGVPIIDLEIKSDAGGVFTRYVTLEVSSFDQFDKILDRLERIKGVLCVEKEL